MNKICFSSQYDVVIVGAGPVGLYTAIQLGASGLRVAVIEKNSAIEKDLRASTFHPPTLEMLDSIGITAKLIDHGLIAPTWQVRMHETQEFAEFDLSILKGHTRFPFRLQCEQWRLSEFLVEYIEESLSNVELHWSCHFLEFTNFDDSVCVRLEDSKHQSIELTCSYLIGADGSKSNVRKGMHLTFEGETFPETTILVTTDFPFHEYLPNLSSINYCWKTDGTFSLLRLKDLWRVSLYPDDSQPIEQAIEIDSIRKKLNQVSPDFGDHEIQEVRPYRIHQRVVNRYRIDRVILAGDSAHINSPSGGMGMNGGIHDGHNLSKKLIQIFEGGNDSLLDLYERQRRPIAIKHVIEQSAKNRARMQERDQSKRTVALRELQVKSQDPKLCLEFLLETSMINGLNESNRIN